MPQPTFSVIVRIMRTKIFITSLLVATVCGTASADIQVGATTQLSLSTTGGAPAGQSNDPAFSANGRYAAFTSGAGDIVSGDTNTVDDVFLRDLNSGTVTIASVSSTGAVSDGTSYVPAVSSRLPDGTFAVVFASDGKNMGSDPAAPPGTNIFIRFPTMGITEILSSSVTTGTPDNCFDPSVALVQDIGGNVDARVVFESAGSNFVEGDTNQQSDIYLVEFRKPTSATYDRAAQVRSVSRLSIQTQSGPEPDGTSEDPEISGNGEYVVFVSSSTNLVPNFVPVDGARQIYRINRVTKVPELISRDTAGNPANGDCYSPSISFNGRYVTYITDATNIVAGATGNNSAIVRFDTVNGTSERVNISEAGIAGDSRPASVSTLTNGRFIVFNDASSNLLTTADTNDTADTFVKDMETGEVARLSVGPGGVEANSFSEKAVIASDTFTSLSASVIYASYATNLTEPSTSTGLSDVYRTTLSFDPPPLTSSTTIDIPPDIKVGLKRLTFTVQKFNLPQEQANIATGLRVRYQFDITQKTKRNGRPTTIRSNLIQKRNRISLVRTAASKGRYSVRARAMIVNTSTGQTETKTAFSPRQRFRVS